MLASSSEVAAGNAKLAEIRAQVDAIGIKSIACVVPCV
jgi:hypothetical protein